MRILGRALVGATVVALCARASADTITFTVTTAMAHLPWAGDIGVSQFDPALGTLEHVDAALSAQYQGQMRCQNLDYAVGLDYTFQNDYFDTLVKGPDNLDLVHVHTDPVITSGHLDPFQGVIHFAPPDGVTFDYEQTGTDAQQAADLAPYVGSGMVWLFITSSSHWQWQASGSETYILETTFLGGADFSLTYTYSVPEPGTFAALAVALIVWRRRLTSPMW